MPKSCKLSIVLLLLAIAGITACRSHRKITVPEPETTEGIVFYTSCYPIESLYVPSCKLEVSFGNDSYSLNGSIYIRPDSVCFFRGRWLLFEIRGVIYRETFLVVNYVERICYKGKNEYLQKITGYPVNPESLMMLFTADRCEEVWRNRFNFVPANTGSEKMLMQGKNRSLIEMNFNSQSRTVENIALYNNSQPQPIFSADYSNYEHYPQFTLPTMINISTHDGQTPVRIKANIQQILFNQPQRVNISVSSGFKVVVLE